MVVKPHGYQLKCPDVYLNNSKPEYVVKAKNVGINMKDDEDMLRHLHSFFMPSLIVSFGKLSSCKTASI